MPVVCYFDGEFSVRIVSSQFRVPHPPRKFNELGPLLERTAGEVNQYQTPAILDNISEIGTGLWTWIGNFPVHKVQHNYIIIAKFIARQVVRLFSDCNIQSFVRRYGFGQNRCSQLPLVPRIINAGNDQNLLVGRLALTFH